MRYRYFVDFRHGVSVFANFSNGIAVLATPPLQAPPPPRKHEAGFMFILLATINNCSSYLQNLIV